MGNLTFYDSKRLLIPFLCRVGTKSPSIMFNHMALYSKNNNVKWTTKVFNTYRSLSNI